MLYNIEPEVKIKEGCTVYTGSLYGITKQGAFGVMEWPLKNKDGGNIDINEVNSAEILARVYDSVNMPPLKVTDVTVDKTNSVISFELPDKLLEWAGVYEINLLLKDTSHNKPIYISDGYIMVERTIAGDSRQRCSVMPRIDDIRQIVSDYTNENTYFFEEEFSNSDIIQAIIRPVREWNSTVPLLRNYTFTCNSFPFMEPWLKAAAGYLYRRSVTHYLRNKLLTAHAGMQGDDLDRDKPYLEMSNMWLQDWRVWMATMKRALNVMQFQGPMRQSVYGALPIDLNLSGRFLA